jgi:hypothetical protein
MFSGFDLSQQLNSLSGISDVSSFAQFASALSLDSLQDGRAAESTVAKTNTGGDAINASLPGEVFISSE